MKRMTLSGIILSAILILAMMPASASDVTYKIRSTIYDNSDPSIDPGDFYWDANSFSGFWYKIKPGLSSEVIYLHNDIDSSSTFKEGDEIEEEDLYYVSKPQMKKSKIGGSDDGPDYVVDGVDLKKYYLMGFFGSQYIAMPEDPDDLSAGCKPDKIAKILMELKDENKKQMTAGEEWVLAGGWSLVVQQLDVDGEKVWIQLKKDGEEMDSAVISGKTGLSRPEKTYLYKDDDDYPIFYCYVESLFKGTTDDLVVFKYAFLRGDLITINTGDTYGIFDVDGFEVPAELNGTDYAGSGSGTVLKTGDDALVMSSNKDVTLDADSTVDLYGDMYIQIEDKGKPALKMSLWKKCTISTGDDDPADKETETAEEEKETETVVKEENDDKDTEKTTSSTENTGTPPEAGEVEDPAEATAGAPGFGIVIGIAGVLAAARIRK
jgi:S-layer protein (TIGR01567 family)